MANLAIDFDVLRDAIEEMSFSCDVSDVKLDGQWHRCSVAAKNKQNTDGAYKGWDDGVPCMYCKNWVTGEAKTFHLWQKGRTLSPEEERQYKERIEQAKAEDEKEQKRKWAEAKKKASSLWQRALKTIPADFPYLKKKQLDAAVFNKDEVRFLKACTIKGKDYPDQLVVPVYGEEGLMSLSRIDGDGNKKFLFGGKTEGGHCILAGTQDLSKDISLDEPQVFLIGEGLATVKSACLATGYTGVVVFDCNKMLKGTQLIRKHNPKAKFVILEDDDRKQEATSGNPGVEHAYETAKAVNAYIAHVEAPEGVSMDFNDLYCTAGAEAVKAKIEAALQAETPSATWEMNRLWVEEHKRGNVVFQPKVKAADKGAAKAAEPAQPEPWVEPVSFASVKIPPIKTEFLPTLLGNYCSEMAREVQVPVELFLSEALAAISAAAQGDYVVRIDGFYTVPVNLYTMCPLDPSNRKTSTVNHCRLPLLNWEKEKNSEIKETVKQLKRSNRVIEQRIMGIENQLRKGVDDKKAADLQKEMERLEKQLKPLPAEIKLSATNPTPEGLTRAMLRNHERMAILSDEGGFLDIIAGRYSSGVPNLDIIKQGWDGSYYSAERSNKENDICLYQPLLAIGLTPQPDVLMTCFANRTFRTTGVHGRFLYFTPESLRGKHKRRMTRQEPKYEASRETKLAYIGLIHRLLNNRWDRYQQELDMGCNERLDPVILEITDEAYAAWAEYDTAWDTACGDDGEFAEMPDWGGKLAGHVARLAGLFHIIENDDPAGSPISEEEMVRAIYLGQILIEHAKNAYGIINTEEAESNAQKILTWIETKKLKTFSLRDCKEAMKRQMKPACVDPALSELEDRYYIREQEVPYTGKGRKPKRGLFEVNPKFLKPSKD